MAGASGTWTCLQGSLQLSCYSQTPSVLGAMVLPASLLGRKLRTPLLFVLFYYGELQTYRSRENGTGNPGVPITLLQQYFAVLRHPWPSSPLLSPVSCLPAISFAGVFYFILFLKKNFKVFKFWGGGGLLGRTEASPCLHHRYPRTCPALSPCSRAQRTRGR